MHSTNILRMRFNAFGMPLECVFNAFLMHLNEFLMRLECVFNAFAMHLERICNAVLMHF